MTSGPNDFSFVKQESNNYNKEVLEPAENPTDSTTTEQCNKTESDKKQLQNINITDTQISLMNEDKTAKLINTKLLLVSPYLG